MVNVQIPLTAALLGGLLLASGCGASDNQAASAPESGPARVSPVAVGEPMPASPVATVDSNNVDLREALRGKPSLVIFYRGHW